ncbi:FG-GAP-like repeat-containing protein [Streptomyces bambusae]|uniref:FG-GAP repeat domain-containing protein n=1 Tax=Streptomyces bambusae TaxID=1550616 RepID=UPI001CFCD285|nr:VCBS repeat-containing protein [Streptomyces bambusae]MCB5168302.1 FG-GAP-like repeat-containing protein [Streptomyces bambusae]
MTAQHRGRLRALAAGGVLALAAGALSAAPSTAATPHRSPGSGPARPATVPAPDSASATGARREAKRRTVVPPRAAERDVRAAVAAKPRHDLDGDGKSDMMVMEYDNLTAAYLSSIATWTEYEIYKTDPDSSFKDLLPVGDVGGTTTPELLSLSFDGKLTLYEAGVKSTSAPKWSGSGWQIYNRVVATGDVSGDRRMDLLARDHDGGLWLYTGTGSVSKPFNSRVKVGSGWGIYDQLVGASDVDGDGLGDVYGRTLSGDLYFYKGAGSATAPLKPRVKVASGWNIYNVITGPDDLDGDGKSDLLARNRDGLQYFYKSIGGGKFAARSYYSDGWEDNKFIVGAGTTSLYGKSQTLGTESNNNLAKYNVLANGYYRTPPIYAGKEATGSRNAYATGLNSHNHAAWVQNIGSDLWIRGQKVSTTWNYPLTVGPGDLSGDGKGDLITRDSGGTLWLHPGDGQLFTRFGTRVKIGTGWNIYDVLVGAGDYSGDKRPDLIARDTDGRLFLYKGTGTAATPFAAREQIGSGWNTYDKLFAPGDMDGDSKADLVGRDRNGYVYRYASTGNPGTGTFAARVKFGDGWNLYKSLY